jgi:hypothetical protein
VPATTVTATYTSTAPATIQAPAMPTATRTTAPAVTPTPTLTPPWVPPTLTATTTSPMLTATAALPTPTAMAAAVTPTLRTPTLTATTASPTLTATAALPTPTAMAAAPTPTTTRPRPTPADLDTERVRNGDFEDGFSAQGVAQWWNRFSNGGATLLFGDENLPPTVYDSYHAQRIRIEGASQPDRYAGIYQVVTVVPHSTYRMVLHGLIRSGAGDVARSQYGYRLQLGLDYAGGQDWRRVTQWVELPWDEQPFDALEPVYGTYEQALQAAGPRLTIFIRAWQKWSDPAPAEYTLDGVSLIGPKPISEMSVESEGEMSAQGDLSAAAAAGDVGAASAEFEPLPTTGSAPTPITLPALASGAVIALLLAGAAWRAYRRG